MTVCLAAMCVADEGGSPSPRVVVAADRMVTLGGFIEFEHAVPKMTNPSSSSLVMIAGDTLTGTRLAREVAESLKNASPRTMEIAKALATRYADVRSESIETHILSPRGLSLSAFYGAHASLNQQVTMMIDQQMLQHNLGVELLLGGVDGDGAHIFSIMNPGGVETQHDVIGYAATGSGAIHALQAMIGFEHQPMAALEETVFRVYAAKRRAEVAPGVGHQTDLAIISASGIDFVDQQQLEILEAAYQDHEDSTKQSLSAKLDTLNLATEESRG